MDPNQQPSTPTPNQDPTVPADAVTSNQPSVISPGQAVTSSEPITSPQPGAVMGDTGVTGAPVQSSPKKNTTLFALVGGGVVIVIIIVALLATSLLHKSISRDDISKAQTNANDINTALIDADTAYSEAESATSTTELNSKLSEASSKLSSAESTYATLKKSPVLGDKTVKAKFDAVDKKWTPYISYLQDDTSDFKALGGPLVSFKNSANDLTKQAPSTAAGLAPYLSKFKTIIDTATSQTSTLKLKVDTNQQLLTAFQAFLSSSSSAVNQAQSDLSSGKDSFTVEDDLFKIDDAQTSFDDATSKLEDQATSKQKQLDVSDQFDAFDTALNNLLSKTKS